MGDSKQMKKNSFSNSSILLIVFAIILIVIVIIMFSSGKKETETTKGETKQVSTNTSVEENRNSNNNSSQTTQEPAVIQEPEEFVEKLDNGTKVNTSEKVKQTKKISGFEVTDINLTSSNGISTMIATVKNTGSTKTEEKEVTIQILDKEGNVITDFLGVINPVEPGATTTLNASVTADVSNAYDFKLIEK